VSGTIARRPEQDVPQRSHHWRAVDVRSAFKSRLSADVCHEAKLDAIIAAVDFTNALEIIEGIDREYASRHTVPRWTKLAAGGRAPTR
jgi:hypothetical protein